MCTWQALKQGNREKFIVTKDRYRDSLRARETSGQRCWMGGLRVSQRNGKMNHEACDRFCFCSQIHCLFLYMKIMLFSLTDIKLGLVTYFDWGKVSNTIIGPSQSIPSLFSLSGELPVPDGSCQSCPHHVSWKVNFCCWKSQRFRGHLLPQHNLAKAYQYKVKLESTMRLWAGQGLVWCETWEENFRSLGVS